MDQVTQVVVVVLKEDQEVQELFTLDMHYN
jgi:hypothetical protein